MPTRTLAPWQAAASFAAKKHLNQVRQDGVTPYAAHPFRVAMTVRHVFGCDDEVALTAALLHDLIEDTTVDWDEIEERFGREVAECVAALTKNAALPEDEREAAYDRGLARAGWRAHIVKLADCYDNFSDVPPGDLVKEKKVRGKCERALKIVEGSTHEGVRRAALALRGLLGAGVKAPPRGRSARTRRR